MFGSGNFRVGNPCTIWGPLKGRLKGELKEGLKGRFKGEFKEGGLQGRASR